MTESNLVHIADGGDPEKEFEVVVALCGRTGLIWPDATLTPADFDFVHLEWAENATCSVCRMKLRRAVEAADRARAKVGA